MKIRQQQLKLAITYKSERAITNPERQIAENQ